MPHLIPGPRAIATLALLTAPLALPAAVAAQERYPVEEIIARLERTEASLRERTTIAYQLMQLDEPVGAYRVLEPVIADHPDDLAFQRFLGDVATGAGMHTAVDRDAAAARAFYEAAARAYDRALTPAGIGSADASTMARAIVANRELGRTERAIAIARQATQRFSRDAVVWSQYAQTLSAAGQHREAAAAYDRLLREAPAHPGARVQRARARLEAGQREAALEDFAAAAAAGEGGAVSLALHSAGRAALQAGRFEEASNMLEMAGRYADGEGRLEINFFHGLALYRQAEAIARANTEGDGARAGRALELFRRAETLLRDSQNAQRDALLEATRQFIANQEAIIREAEGG